MTLMTDPSTLDQALAAFHSTAPEFGGGLSNHGPMVVESLEHAGRSDSIYSWTTGYLSKLDPLPSAPAEAAASVTIEPALGGAEPDTWTRFFLDQIDRRGVDAVIDEWAARLLPGAVGAAGHGALRAAHAIRSLDVRSTDARVVEVAHGLGYWASRFHALPGRSGGGRLSFDRALAVMRPTPTAGWLISERVASIDPRSFGAGVSAAHLPSDPGAAFDEISDLALRVLATHQEATIAFVHAVTVPAALRHLSMRLDREGRRAAAEQAWWVLAALWTAYGRRDPLVGAAGCRETWDELLDRAIAGGDEHHIKLSAAVADESPRVDDALARFVVARVLGAV